VDRAGVALEETCALHGELRRWVPERSHGRHSGRASPAHRRQPESVNGSRRHKRPRAPLANARRDPGFFWKIYSQDPYWRLVLAEGPANASRRDPGFPPQVPSQDPYWRLASARARQRVAWGSGFLLEDLQSGSLLCAGAWDGTSTTRFRAGTEGFFWRIHSQDPYWRLELAEGPANGSRGDPGFSWKICSQDPYCARALGTGLDNAFSRGDGGLLLRNSQSGSLLAARAREGPRQRVAWGSGFLLEDLQSGSLLCAGAWDGTLLVLASVRIPEVVARGAAFQRRRGAAAATWRAAVRCRTTENDAQRARSRACTQSPRHEEVPGGGTKPLIRTSSPSLFLFRNRTKPGRADSRAHRRGLRSRDRGTRPGSRMRGA
jgi:hypothetical protein